MNFGQHLARSLTPPAPMWVLIAHACMLAALSAAFAPLFGNDPSSEAALGFDIGMLTGLPVYVGYLIGRRRK